MFMERRNSRAQAMDVGSPREDLTACLISVMACKVTKEHRRPRPSCLSEQSYEYIAAAASCIKHVRVGHQTP